MCRCNPNNSTTSKVYRVYNKRISVVEETVHVAFDESKHLILCHEHDEDALAEVPKIDQIPNSEALEKVENKKENQTNNVQINWRILHDHPEDYI